MPIPEDREKRRRQWRAGGGFRGNKSIKPMLAGEWRPGMPCHWMEQTTFLKWKFILLRIILLINVGAAAAYLQYRARETIGIFSHRLINFVRVYQYIFFALECCSAISIIFRMLEAWNLGRRNCIDFKQIPNELIAPHFHQMKQSQNSSSYSNYPSIGVFIPCYNEDVDLVLETVIGAVNIDYPKELLTIYLCDDGKDPAKRSMISQLRKQHKNLHYVIRPDNSHAKAGNLNYSLERTSSDLVVTLDADFVARPNILQRLIPYYYVWNEATGLYEFNETVAVVQTPQHYRNLSPYESDPLDQRSTFFLTLVLPGKDWFNASTMIGTTNLISRAALQEANYYPYHSITEDTAMSLVFHSKGYRTYYVNESLATGLATTSLWSNLSQRARWLKGDWQILFSLKGPLFIRGLTIFQRILYLNMTYARVISIVHFCYDLATVFLLIGGIPPLDAANPLKFIIFISAYLGTGLLAQIVVTLGREGLGKSASASVAFEAIFRYFTIKGIVMVMFLGKKLKFKVTDKSGVKTSDKAKVGEDGEAPERFDESSRMTVLGQSGPDEPTQGIVNGRRQSLVSDDVGHGTSNESEINAESDRQSSVSTANEDGSSIDESEDDFGKDYKKRHKTKTPEEKKIRRRDILKNLRRVWFNIFTAIVLIGAIVYAIIGVPSLSKLGGDDDVVSVDDNVFLLAVAVGFAMANLLPHLLTIYLCFIPYVSGWVMSDLIHGRCDQYAVHPRTGRLFVPWSFISLLGVAQLILIFGAIIALGVFSFGDYGLSETVKSSRMLLWS